MEEVISTHGRKGVPMEDQEIVQLFWERSETAIKETEIKYGAKLHHLAMKILNSRLDAEESVNDTFLETWNTIPPEKPDYFFAYIAKICRYLSFGKLDWRNAKKRSAELVSLTSEMELCIPDPSSEIDEGRTGEEIGQLINKFLSVLSEEKRLIFMRRYWYTDSVRSISERYGISESKVKTTLFRTRNDLKEFLRKEGVTV
ncbi:RNA polymerase sigma factor [Acutalibacter muris]|uniref:RNA polymerase sigma factor n=1 Tax=Acutalibacter muris TaxID=1796620 RepID=UPI0020CE3427|nr:sigma-70 family RNA polymerase sigma factor [Acutalibacter muris]